MIIRKSKVVKLKFIITEVHFRSKAITIINILNQKIDIIKENAVIIICSFPS